MPEGASLMEQVGDLGRWFAGAGGVQGAAQRLLDRQKRNGLKWAAGLLRPKAAAAVAATRLEPGNFRAGRSTVLCLTRPHFSLDVEQLRKLDNVNWIGLNLIMLGEMQRAWAQPRMQQQTFYQATLNDASCAADWQRMNAFALGVLRRIDHRYPLSALLCANIDYWQAESFRHASHQLGLPFLVLSRENLLTRYDEKLILERYRGFRFQGDAVAVFGEWMREALLRAGAVRPEQIVVTGAPRLDVWNRAAATEARRDCVVLISFADPNYYAPETFRVTLQRFLAAALRNADSPVRFVIKAKGKEDGQMILAMCEGRLPPNVALTGDASLEELLPQARLVVGFNSMAVFDALFTCAPVATPDMPETRAANDSLMFDPHDALCRDVLRFYRQREELDSLLDSASKGALAAEQNGEQRRRLIGRFVHFPVAGSATESVERFVVDRIRRPPAPEGEAARRVA
jgi:hypothetical protein